LIQCGVYQNVQRDDLEKPLSQFAGKKGLDVRAGVKDWTAHDIRRSVAVAPHIIEAVLNHQSGHKAGPAGIYNRSSYVREVRAALIMWEDHIRALTDGGERKVLTLYNP
jgi:hypothetical protein